MKISIITVVKNDVKGIEKTIKSVLNQSQKEIEYIVVDGMSEDGTSEIISKYNYKVKHIREPDTGIYNAINKGIRKANGEYIGLLHSGDVYHDLDSLKKAVTFMNMNKLNAASFNMAYKQNQNLIRYWKLNIQNLNKFNCYKIAHPTLIIKKKLISNLTYNEAYRISGDYDFLIKLTKLKKLRYQYNDTLLQINQYGGISTSIFFLFEKLNEDLNILRKNFSFIFLFILFLKIVSKIKSFFFKVEKYDTLFLNYYLSDINGFSDERHYNFFNQLSKNKKYKTLFVGCSNNHFQKQKKYIFKNKNIDNMNITSINYNENKMRIISILIFNLKLLFQIRIFLNCKRIFITVPDYSTIIIANFFAKIFSKKLIVEIRDVYPENIKPYIKNKFLYILIKFITSNLEKLAIKNATYIISNLPFYHQRLKLYGKSYLKKLSIMPNICGFNFFNNKKNFVYAGSTSKINNFEKINFFFNKLNIKRNQKSFFLVGRNLKNQTNMKLLQNKLKHYGFGIFSFDNDNSLKYGINHKKLNLYFDNGLIPIFLGSKQKFSKYFFSHFPIIFFENFSNNFNNNHKHFLKIQKKIFQDRNKIRSKAKKRNKITLNELNKIFYLN